MAKQEEKQITEPVVNPTPKEGPVDLTKRVEVTTTDKAPFHKKDTKLRVAPAVADKMKANGWAK
jgi:hypothetical protein